ncbi:flavin-containing monooxygenase [Mycobacteroides abscessus]|uniref:flavin-containing monooxygenase n=1 Tax=Mycobacteroides abscessus TaxID=36809 RepID=UPI001F442ACD|nr:NAD(P)/FAD-dependent oxidoreductase [Mycobacteroides abscessus]MDO3333954.1 NAD(P)/FAD-dependent oxidoreductase [Mycobacteroides abscessus subsp. bolletii]
MGHVVDAVIVGAGFSGIAAAIELKKLGHDDIVVIEREDDVGGTWFVNRYPGAAVDIFSSTYQYWFEPNPRWGRLYAEGSELHAYARTVSEKYGVLPHVRLGTAVDSAIWDDDDRVWNITLSTGEIVAARFLVNATGFLSQRHYPDIDGLGTFDGEILHTTWWDPATDLRGRHIGVIGTGATAVQLLPELAKQADSLTVYQRTPIWVTPKFDFAVPEQVKNAFQRVPLLRKTVAMLTNMLYQFILTTAVINHRRFRRLTSFVEWQCKALMFVSVRDKALRHKLTPDYSFGCKRPSLSNTYYRMFAKPHVSLQTAGIARIEPDGIVANDGTKTPIDTLVLATGFNVWEHNFPSYATIGRDGVDLGKWWRAHRYASYEGITVPNFPNYLGMTSPFAFTGVSYFDTIRAQTVHMNRLFGELRRRGATTFEVSEDAALEWTERMRTKMNDSVLFQGRCASSNTYYFNDDGDACWFRPTSSRAAFKQQARFPLGDYRIV